MSDARRPRRTNGEGTAPRQRPDGRWECRISLGVDDAGRYVRKSVYGASSAEVLDKAAKLRLGFDQAPKRQGTIAELLERWLVEKVQPRRKPGTFRNYDWACRKWIVPNVGSDRVEHFGPRQVERLYATIRRAGASDRIQDAVHTTLHVAFRQAMRWEMVDRNPCGEDYIEAPSYTAKKRKALTQDEVRRLIAVAESHRLYGAIPLPLATGVRPGEVFGLLWKYVDLKRGLIEIENTLDANTPKPELGTPKTVGSVRVEYLPPIAIEALRSRRIAQIAEGNAASRYVFCDVDGGPIRQSNFRRDVWLPILVAAGLAPAAILKMLGRKPKGEPRRKLPPVLHHHDLRHTFSTLQKAAGTDLHVLKEVLGHSSIAITSDIYTHRDEAEHRAVAERTERFLRGQDEELSSSAGVNAVDNAS